MRKRREVHKMHKAISAWPYPMCINLAMLGTSLVESLDWMHHLSVPKSDPSVPSNCIDGPLKPFLFFSPKLHFLHANESVLHHKGPCTPQLQINIAEKCHLIAEKYHLIAEKLTVMTEKSLSSYWRTTISYVNGRFSATLRQFLSAIRWHIFSLYFLHAYEWVCYIIKPTTHSEKNPRPKKSCRVANKVFRVGCQECHRTGWWIFFSSD